MRFRGSENFSHSQADKVGVLITNLGTPEAPEPKALRKYLAQFLSDPRVVEIPKLIWMLILHGIILRVRPKKSAEAYKEVWTERGSPLKYYTEDQAQALQAKLSERYGEQVEVAYAMRYGAPAIADVADTMLQGGVRKLLVLPLYPQYSGSTTGSTFDALSRDFQARRWLPHLRFVASYHDYPLYIDAMAQKIRAYWDEHGQADKLILSFHGVPKHFLTQGDPYHCQCHVTGRLLAQALGLTDAQFMVTFQSRFGKAEWLKPYTDMTLKALPGEGCKSVQVFCPGFSADCLETIEEIAVENRDYFMEAGGDRYEYIPALNADAAHIDALASIVNDNLGGWVSADRAELTSAEALAQREQRYQTHEHNK